jgi:MFS family permease
VYGFFPRSRRFSYRGWYLFFLLLLTVVTSVTVLLDEPGTLILVSAVIGFVGTVIYSVALIVLNHVYLPRHLPKLARPGADQSDFSDGRLRGVFRSCGAVSLDRSESYLMRRQRG